ncbi:MAG: hypothetical protein RIT35_1463 [Pseudomonadota bacterium]|jgi:hypothetical protein
MKLRKTSYRWDISIALLTKFLLLGLVWWVFFAGHKQPVDSAIIGDKFLGEHPTIITTKQNKELLL